jgi:hypothetical protein
MRRIPTRAIPLLAVLLAVTATHLSVAADLPHYAMTLIADYDAGSLMGELRVEYQNTTGIELGELFFRLYPNAPGIYGDASVRIIETLVNEQAVATETFVGDTVLLVPLPEPLAPDALVSVTIAFEGIAEDWPGDSPSSDHAYGLLTRSEHALTLTAFYPILALYTEEGWSLDPVFEFGDALMSEASTYEVILTIPAGITPVASGTLSEELHEDATATYRYTAEGARDFSLVLLEGYGYWDVLVDGVTLRAWFGPKNGRAAGITLDHASDALRLFTDLIGPLRHDEVKFVEVPMQHAAGVEFSGLILVSSGYARNPEDTFYDIIVSHEMAHQWFYSAVGNDITEDPWLDESLATYLSYLFLDAFSEAGIASGVLGQWKDSYDAARAVNPAITIASPVYAFSRSSTYSSFVYSGGAIFLHTVREAIGDEPFFAALAAYFSENLGRIASPADLLAAFEASCGCPLSETFHEFGLRP